MDESENATNSSNWQQNGGIRPARNAPPPPNLNSNLAPNSNRANGRPPVPAHGTVLRPVTLFRQPIEITVTDTTVEDVKAGENGEGPRRQKQNGHARSKSHHLPALTIPLDTVIPVTECYRNPQHRRVQSNATVGPLDALALQTDAALLALTGKRIPKLTVGEHYNSNRTLKAPKNQLSSSLRSQKNLFIAKKRYSVWRRDSLMVMEMEQFSDSDRRLRKSVPSSRQTILALAGLFICGLILMINGIIVLATTWNSSKRIPDGWLYRLAGLIMLSLGFIGLIICALLQRKNIGKFVDDMTRDLFNVASNAAASEEKAKRADEGGSKKLSRMLSEVPSTMI